MISERPTYQALPPLSTWEREELKRDIEAQGVLEPVVVDEDGNVIDGHHRRAICEELRRPYPTRTVPGLSDQQKRAMALTLNLLRRHLSTEQKRALIVQYVQQYPGESDRAIASWTGVDHKTVGSLRRQNGDLDLSPDTPARLPGEFPQTVQSDYHEPEDAAADHRGMCWFEVTYGYPAPSPDERTRAGLPYPKASERRSWSTGRFYVQHPAPADDVDVQRIWREVAEQGIRRMRANPPATVRR